MRRFFTIASAGVIVGFAIGLKKAMLTLGAHHYLQYKLCILSLISLRTHLNRWTALSLFVAVALYGSWYFGRFVLRRIWTAFLAPFLEVRFRSSPILRRRLLGFSTALALSLSGLFFFNYLYPGYRYSPASVGGDIVIVLGAVCAGFLRARKKETRLSLIVRSLKWGGGLRVTGLALVLLLLALNGFLAVEGAFFPPRGANVVIICVDALRADHLGCYGYERQTSPNIDNFSREAKIFYNAISQCSWTSPSVASIFTSLYPSTHGVTAHWGRKNNMLNKRWVLLAELLKNKGYDTAAFVANHFIRRNLDFDQGFDVFDEINADYKPMAEEVNKKVTGWLAGHKDHPFFLYVHYMDVHGPYKPPPPYDSMFKADKPRKMSEVECIKMAYLLQDEITDLNYYIDQYDGEIRYVDHSIGEILMRLKENGLFDKSIIVVTSDHGEEFFEHGWCNHGLTLYDELIKVPLIVRFPGGENSGEGSKMLVQMVDLGPTILDIVGGSFPYGVRGRSLLRSGGNGGAGLGDRAAFSEEHEWQDRWKSPPKVAMVENGYKYIYYTRDEEVAEVYDLQKDPGERHNLAGDLDERVAEVKERIAGWLKTQEREASQVLSFRKSAAEDEVDEEALRALGYL